MKDYVTVKTASECSSQTGRRINFQGIVSLETVPNARALSQKGKGVVTIVYDLEHGRRLELLKPLVDELQIQDTVQLGMLEESLVIGKKLPNVEQAFSVRDLGKKKVIYSTPLVKEVIEKLNLDFSKRTSLTLHKFELEEYEGSLIARVWARECED